MLVSGRVVDQTFVRASLFNSELCFRTSPSSWKYQPHQAGRTTFPHFTTLRCFEQKKVAPAVVVVVVVAVAVVVVVVVVAVVICCLKFSANRTEATFLSLFLDVKV